MDVMIVFSIVVVFFLILCGLIGGFMFYHSRIFKYKIRLFYKLSGDPQYHEGKTYKARRVFLSKGGVQRLWCPKLKEYVSYFGKKMGKNMFYYAEGPDGFLYNIVLGDLDTAQGVLDIEPIDRDLRDFYITNMKNINERYTKPKSWPVILQSLTIVLIIVLMFVGGYILFGQMKEAGTITNQNLEQGLEIGELNKQMILATQNLVESLGKGGSPSGIQQT